MKRFQCNPSPQSDEPTLRLLKVSKSFGDVQALQGVTFQVRRQEVVGVLGPSGCGKSTLLAVVAGLEEPDQGQVLWEGEDLEGTATHKRGFGLMFQDFALFPHLRVFANVAFGLHMANRPRGEVERQVQQALKLVGLRGFEGRDVNTLSGGEKQRVALARALVPRPRLLMLDEPLGSLDRTLRERLMLDLRGILRELGQTALYVTHDQEEAFAVADRVVLMKAGEVVQVGTPEDIYRGPASLFVARFLGLSNFLKGRIIERGGEIQLQTEIGRWPWEGQPGEELTVLLRPDQVRLDGRGPARLRGEVVERSFRGSLCRAVIEVEGTPLVFDFSTNQPIPEAGGSADLSFDPKRALQALQ